MAAPPWPSHPVAALPACDDFDADRLCPHWISVRSRPAEHVSLVDRPGWLTLRARGGSLDKPDIVFVGRRQQQVSCRVRALADTTQGHGGIAIRLDERHHYEVEAGGGQVRVVARIGSICSTVAVRPTGYGPVRLRIDVLASHDWDPRKEPDLIRLGMEEEGGEFHPLAELDGRYLSTEVAGGFTGRVIGMYATDGTVHFDWFDYEPIEPGDKNG